LALAVAAHGVAGEEEARDWPRRVAAALGRPKAAEGAAEVHVGLGQANVEAGLEAVEARTARVAEAVCPPAVRQEEEQPRGRRRVEAFPHLAPCGAQKLLSRRVGSIRERSEASAMGPARVPAGGGVLRVLVWNSRPAVGAVCYGVVAGDDPKVASDAALHGLVPIGPAAAYEIEEACDRHVTIVAAGRVRRHKKVIDAVAVGLVVTRRSHPVGQDPSVPPLRRKPHH